LKGHSKRVCQDIPTDPWEKGLREAEIVVQCGTSNCPGGQYVMRAKYPAYKLNLLYISLQELPQCAENLPVSVVQSKWTLNAVDGVESPIKRFSTNPTLLYPSHGNLTIPVLIQVVLTAIIPTCQPQPAKKIGLNMGRKPGGRELAVDGLAMAQDKLPTVSANETSTTFYLTMQDPLDLKDHGVFIQPPVVKFTDYLGHLNPVVTEGKDGGLVGRSSTMTERISFPITVVYNCKGSESIATMTMEIKLHPYDSMFISWQKVCAFSAERPEMPMDLIATHLNGEVQMSWAPPSSANGSPVSFYIVEALSNSLQLPIRISLSTDFKNAPHVQSLSPVTYIWRGLPGGIMYTFRVAAVNGAGTSLYSPQSMPLQLAVGPTNQAYSGPHTGLPTGVGNAPNEVAALKIDSGATNWSPAGLAFFWMFLFGLLGCLATCLYRTNQGETGLEIMPGHSYIYELDDMYCGGQFTQSCRVWKPLGQSDDGQGAASAPPGISNVRNEAPGDIPMEETTTFAGASPQRSSTYSSAGPPVTPVAVNPFASGKSYNDVDDVPIEHLDGSNYDAPVSEDWTSRDPDGSSIDNL